MEFKRHLFAASIVLLGLLINNTSVGQDSTESVIAEHSELSAALPAGEWARVESAVDRGLSWLSQQQAEDGSFPSDDNAQPAVTSLAVMAFLSRGHVPDQGPYGSKLSRAIDFVLSTQRRQGYFALRPVVEPIQHLSSSQTATYNHSIAGLMLGEVYGMTSGERSQRIEDALHLALSYHREVQSRRKEFESDFGGWRYAFPNAPKASSDMSVTGWALMFLRSARNAEFNVPKQYFDEGLDFVERCYDSRGLQPEAGVFRYRPEDGNSNNPQITLANTSSAALTLILGGRQNHPGVAHTVRWLLSQPYPKPWQNGYFYLSTYYTSQAMAQVGGETWNQLFPQIAANLLGEQSESGAWPAGASNERPFGESYATSLAILSLTPAYQLLPIYQR